MANDEKIAEQKEDPQSTHDRAATDIERKGKGADKVQFFNPWTGRFEDEPPAQIANLDPVAASAEMHEAIRDGKPLPSDRTEEQLRELEPGRRGAAVTAAGGVPGDASTPSAGRRVGGATTQAGSTRA